MIFIRQGLYPIVLYLKNFKTMKKLAVFAYLIFVSVSSFSQAVSLASDSTLSLLFIGDVMGHGPQINAAYDSNTDSYSYDSVFCRMKPVFNLADIAIANLEVTLAGKPYTGYPQFSSPNALAEALKAAGVDVLVNANNHAADRGKSGIIKTIQTLDTLAIPHTGTFQDEAERDTTYPLILVKNGFRIALLNYTYGTNGIEVPSPVIVNTIDMAQIRKDVDQAKRANVDEVIAFVHWGIEYQNDPNREQERLASYLHGLGIRIVIGSHPHVIQRMEASYDTDSTTGSVTVYSLGNFVSNQRDRYKNGGALAYLTLTKHNGRSKISSAGYILDWVQRPIQDGRRIYQVLPVSEYEQQEGYFSGNDKALFDEFASDARKLYGKENVGVPEIRFNRETNSWEVKR